VAALMAKMKAASALLESVEVADLYQSSPDGLCPAGATDSSETYNLTLRFTYRSPERTLTETEVKTEHGKVTAILRM
jgi:phenylalanyl-tRNA synthetase beta subunit